MSTNDNIENIYLLTPMQEGMLFHSLTDDADTYFVQLFYRVTGQLDLEKFSDSLNYLVKRRDILRTAFVYDKTEKPI